MKKIFILLLLAFSAPSIFAQEIACLSAYIKSNGDTRYAITLTDNSIWWTDPNNGQWTKVLKNGLPNGAVIKSLTAYVKPTNGDSRYVISLSDNSIWWSDPNVGEWTKVSMAGLPAGYKLKNVSAYVKPTGDSRYTISLTDNTIWWVDPNVGQWTKVPSPVTTIADKK